MNDKNLTEPAELGPFDAHPLRVISGWPAMAKETTRLSRLWRDILTMEQFQELGRAVTSQFNTVLSQVPIGRRPLDSSLMTAHVEMMTRFGMLWQGGCRILSISPNLRDAIRLREKVTGILPKGSAGAIKKRFAAANKVSAGYDWAQKIFGLLNHELRYRE